MTRFIPLPLRWLAVWLTLVMAPTATCIPPLSNVPITSATPITPDMPVITVSTPEGLVRLEGPGAEWLLRTGFPVATDERGRPSFDPLN